MLNGNKTLVINTQCVVGTREAAAAFGLQAIPTLAHETISLSWDASALSGPGVLRVLDFAGRTIAEQSMETSVSEHRFDAGAWPGGAYLIFLENKGRRQWVRVAVAH